MKLTMKEILEKFKDCDMFCLTGCVDGYNITEDEFDKAIEEANKDTKSSLKKMYEDFNNYEAMGYPDFETVYRDIRQECIDFKKNAKEYDADEVYDQKTLNFLKKIGHPLKGKFTDTITSCLGTTKYGDRLYPFYQRISMSTDLEMNNRKYCNNGGKEPIKQVPKKLRDYLLRYEPSFSNEVIISGQMMINYYFALNDKTKEYLLKYKTDFDLDELQDLALFKNGKRKFSSCTHERYNSLGEEEY